MKLLPAARMMSATSKGGRIIGVVSSPNVLRRRRPIRQASPADSDKRLCGAGINVNRSYVLQHIRSTPIVVTEISSLSNEAPSESRSEGDEGPTLLIIYMDRTLCVLRLHRGKRLRKPLIT
jgi:hypothetical protein